MNASDGRIDQESGRREIPFPGNYFSPSRIQSTGLFGHYCWIHFPREDSMPCRIGFAVSCAGLSLALVLAATRLPACCPIGPSGKPVVNADQTVIILWNAATKMQHFIRQASFQSDAADFGFLVPTPTRPELDESGNAAFPYLQKLTEPEIQRVPRPRGGGCGCGEELPGINADRSNKAAGLVEVLEQKRVAGFDAAVLAADSADDLINWLKVHDYEFSPEAEAWAKPYVEAGWMITALKVAKDEEAKENKGVSAAALRLSFQTDRPLFPYREPDSGASAKALGATHRLLRIYCIAEAKYAGELTKEAPWGGNVAWADKIKATDREKVLDLLKLPKETGPAQWWMTEFEDNWAYRVAPADVYFAKAADQNTVKRPPIIQYVSTGSSPDVMACAIVALIIAGPALRRFRIGGTK
jgi:hypothetical protein